jgi:hypothetical protein
MTRDPYDLYLITGMVIATLGYVLAAVPAAYSHWKQRRQQKTL